LSLITTTVSQEKQLEQKNAPSKKNTLGHKTRKLFEFDPSERCYAVK